MVKAEIITIGDEILIGQIIDTNSAWIGKELNLAGINVSQITSISDKSEHILSTLSEASKRSDVVLITGGLGPTKDDITKYTLAKYFAAKKMVTHLPTLEYIKQISEKRGIKLIELNRLQAEVPENARIITNSCGTAPGMCFEQNGKLFFSMPGVPFEMKTMLPNVINIILEKFGNASAIYHKTLMTFGIPESFLAEKIEDWETHLPNNISLAYLPDRATGIKLRLSAIGTDKNLLEHEVDREFNKLIPIIGDAAYGYEPDVLESVVGKLLINKKATISTAESCTGGEIAHLLTSIPGSSSYYKGSVISYSNDVKINTLGVNPEFIEKYGVVSSEVVKEMALGVKKLLKTDYAIATSGIAGPTGGSDKKPVGLCWFAVSGPDILYSYSQIFTSDRSGNIIRASSTALNYMRLLLL